jgi:hypothetical protein
MSYRLQIVHEPTGEWSLHGLPGSPVVQLDSLSASFDFARRGCGAAPATIELMVDGFYAVIHQEFGWPRRLVALAHDDIPAEPAELATKPRAPGLRGWVGKWGKGS